VPSGPCKLCAAVDDNAEMGSPVSANAVPNKKIVYRMSSQTSLRHAKRLIVLRNAIPYSINITSLEDMNATKSVSAKVLGYTRDIRSDDRPGYLSAGFIFCPDSEGGRDVYWIIDSETFNKEHLSPEELKVAFEEKWIDSVERTFHIRHPSTFGFTFFSYSFPFTISSPFFSSSTSLLSLSTPAIQISLADTLPYINLCYFSTFTLNSYIYNRRS